MRYALPFSALLWCCAGLSACTTAPASGPAAGAVVQGAGEEGIILPTARPALSTEVLPSLDLNGTVVGEAALLQRPKAGSVVLQALPAGERVKVLGALDNAEGRWLSVGLDTLQGWVRAEQIAQDP